MSPMKTLLRALGGRKALKGKVSSRADLKDRIRAGLPFMVLESLLESFDLTREELCAALNLPLRTIARRKAQGKLSVEESDKLVRFARIAGEASAVFGGPERAVNWLRRENRALAGLAPLSLLDTDVGARQVEEVLGRIQHGVHS